MWLRSFSSVAWMRGLCGPIGVNVCCKDYVDYMDLATFTCVQLLSKPIFFWRFKEVFGCRKRLKYRILSKSAALSNSTASLIIPPDFFAFKIYSRLSNSPALWVSHSPQRVLIIPQLQRKQCIAEFRMFLIVLLCRTHICGLLYIILYWCTFLHLKIVFWSLRQALFNFNPMMLNVSKLLTK